MSTIGQINHGIFPQPLRTIPAHWSRFALAKNTCTILSLAWMPVSRCWLTELDTVATDDNGSQSGRRASAFAVRGRLYGPTQRAAHRSRQFINTAQAGGKYSTRGANAAITAKASANAARADAACTAGTSAMFTTSGNTVISQTITTSSREPDPTVDRRSTTGPQRWNHNHVS